MNKATLLDILTNAPNENDHWDFKAEWHRTKGELIRDIINFANTSHHDECYLILGVDDHDGHIVGVEADENKRNRQQLQDLLRSVKFASNGYPGTDVETFSVEGHEIDVVTIFDSDAVPYYLQAEYTKDKRLPSGVIYSRINDSNTPISESTTDARMQELWRKRFHIDRNIQDRFRSYLERASHWSAIRDGQRATFILNQNPDFMVEIVEDVETRSEYEAYSRSQLDRRIGWDEINLRFRGTLLYSNLVNYLDGARLEVCSPIPGVISNNSLRRGSALYYYYSPDRWEYVLTDFLLARQHIDLGSADGVDMAMTRFRHDTVWYRDKDEQEVAEAYLKEHWPDASELTPSDEDVENYAKSSLRWIDRRQVPMDKDEARVILEEYLLGQYLNQCVLPVIRGEVNTKAD